MAEPKGRRGPVLIRAGDLAPEVETPATAPPVPDDDPGIAPEGRAMVQATRLAARRPSLIGRLFWGALVALLSLAIGLAVVDFVTGLLERNLWLGRAALLLAGVLVLALVLAALREIAALARFATIDGLRARADHAQADGDLKAARALLDRLEALYGSRPELAWGWRVMAERKDDVLDADALLALTEREILGPLDTLAQGEIQLAARQVATATALVPLALVDVTVALAANVRMIRRVAEVYGGRAGVVGAWRLLRTVATHLIATGAVAVGDDMLGSVAGGGVLSRFSRRFGEGVVNGALTARVGLAAMEVCRPMAFQYVARPSVAGLLRDALSGVFRRGSAEAEDPPK
ncbi:MAG: TIGR01620 family protein [Pseudomonadota bacterium]